MQDIIKCILRHIDSGFYIFPTISSPRLNIWKNNMNAFQVRSIFPRWRLNDNLAEWLRRWFKVPVRKGVGSSPTVVTLFS
jgi:hypothetical protein